MSYCDQPNCKKFNKCPKKLTIRELQQAEKDKRILKIGNFTTCYSPKGVE